MALPLIPDALTQLLPGLAQIATTADDTVPRALLIHVAALAQEALALTAINAAPLAAATV